MDDGNFKRGGAKKPTVGKLNNSSDINLLSNCTSYSILLVNPPTFEPVLLLLYVHITDSYWINYLASTTHKVHARFSKMFTITIVAI